MLVVLHRVFRTQRYIQRPKLKPKTDGRQKEIPFGMPSYSHSFINLCILTPSRMKFEYSSQILLSIYDEFYIAIINQHFLFFFDPQLLRYFKTI